MRRIISPLVVCLAAFTATTQTNAFQPVHHSHFTNPKHNVKTSSSPSSSKTELYSTSYPSLLSTEREVLEFQDWAVQCGVQAKNGFYLAQDFVDGNEDWFVATSDGGAQGSRILAIPAEMILSSAVIAQEFDGYINPISYDILQQKGYTHLIPQFYLFLKLCMEYEQGENSGYYPWMASFPKTWNTAVSMDSFCMSCLPPYLKTLCLEERDQLAAFREALQSFEYVSQETKGNDEVMKFIYNVVNTRSWPIMEGSDVYNIVPVADFLNHGYRDNVELRYDEDGNCEVILIEDVSPGEPLTLSYGEPTNPAKFLAKYGFLNDDAPATYCKLLISAPSAKLKEIGYDPSKMLFYTEDGGVSQEVWDAVLFSTLERTPGAADAKNAFYEAYMNEDYETKMAIHQHFQGETVNTLLEHVNKILKEVQDLTDKMYQFNSERHPRLPLLLRHHALVTSTFIKVQEYLLSIGY
mmetsp:Transcript_33214/g.48718  ORF Transcript_33214/g.48718 Transcript_33214/m.48718 type:complete len:466 (+) Transcript_33214:123-1520(+)